MVNDMEEEKKLFSKIGLSPTKNGIDRELPYYIFNKIECPECQKNNAFLSVQIIDNNWADPHIVVGCSTDKCLFRSELIKSLEKTHYSIDTTWKQYITKKYNANHDLS